MLDSPGLAILRPTAGGRSRQPHPESFNAAPLEQGWQSPGHAGRWLLPTAVMTRKVLAITAVLLDILQYPCSAEIHAQISLACQVRTFECPVRPPRLPPAFSQRATDPCSSVATCRPSPLPNFTGKLTDFQSVAHGIPILYASLNGTDDPNILTHMVANKLCSGNAGTACERVFATDDTGTRRDPSCLGCAPAKNLSRPLAPRQVTTACPRRNPTWAMDKGIPSRP